MSRHRSSSKSPRGCRSSRGSKRLSPRSSDFYTPDAEGILIWNDIKVGIEWPIKPQVISEKDKKGEVLKKIIPIRLKNS